MTHGAEMHLIVKTKLDSSEKNTMELLFYCPSEILLKSTHRRTPKSHSKITQRKRLTTKTGNTVYGRF